MPTADPVLLLHGQPGSARDWDRVREAIGDRAPTVAIDRPGWNGRAAPSDLEGNAAAALAALDLAGAERAVVVGHSFGGAVAAWLTVSHRERVRGLVLAAPSANAASLRWVDRLLAAPGVGYAVGAAALAGAGAALATERVRTRVARELGLEDGYLRSAGRLLLTPHAWRSFFTEQRLLFREVPALEARLNEITVPTTVVIGTADRIVPVSSARRLTEQLADARLVELERANHLLPQQRAAELAEIIMKAYSA